MHFRRGGHSGWQLGAIRKTDAVWAPTVFEAAQHGSGGGSGGSGDDTVAHRMVLAQPPTANSEILNSDEVRGCRRGCVVVVLRGGGSFDQKISYAEKAGAVAVVVVNNDQSSLGAVRPMSGRGGSWRAKIPAMMISYRDGAKLLRQLQDFDAGEDAADDYVGSVAVEAVFVRGAGAGAGAGSSAPS